MRINSEKIKHMDCCEVINIAMSKSFIINGKKIRINIIKTSLLIFLTFVLLYFFFVFRFPDLNNKFFDIFADVLGVITFFIVFINLMLPSMFKSQAKLGKYTEFEKDKIVEILTNGSTINLDYNNIEYIIYGKRVICLIYGKGKSLSTFFYLIKHKDDILKEIKKHRKDIKVYSYYK